MEENLKMNFKTVLTLLEKYETCPKCGNRNLGNGEGTLETDTNYFKRTCKCGWKVEKGEKK